jgi:hypothetical protein
MAQSLPSHSCQFNDEPIQSVKHGPDCSAKCRRSTSMFESVIPISKDGCTTIMLWIELGYQRGIPTYPWLRKLIYCCGIRKSRFNFSAQWICLSVAYRHGWNTGLARSFGCISLQGQRASVLVQSLFPGACPTRHEKPSKVLFWFPTERRIPRKLNVAFYCLHQRKGGEWAS